MDSKSEYFQDPVAIHIVCGDQNKGSGEKPKKSIVHFHQPWMVNEYGYTTNLFVQLQEVEATTSLKFHKFLESETIEVRKYLPRICSILKSNNLSLIHI